MQNPIFKDTYGALGKYMQDSSQSPNGPTVAIYRSWDPENDKTNLMPAFQVASDTQKGEFELLEVPAGPAYVLCRNL